MRFAHPQPSSARARRLRLALGFAAAVLPVAARAQSGLQIAVTTSPAILSAAAPANFAEAAHATPLLSAGESSSAEASLPYAPGIVVATPLNAFIPPAPRLNATGNTAPHYAKYIPSGWQAQPISQGDKVVIGLRDVVSPLNFAGIVLSAGYSHVLNGEPNYGTDRGAFGQRIGAAALRSTSQGIFTDAVFSPLLRQDPRYYVEGPQYGFVHRVGYAITRPLIGRTDAGHSTVNASLLLGYASASALSYTYYPKINQNFRDTAATFGGSIGGAALGFAVSEFSDQVLKAIHLRH